MHGNAYLSEKKYCLSPVHVAIDKLPAAVEPVVAVQGENCDAACSKKQMHCDTRFIPSINNCDMLTKHFP